MKHRLWIGFILIGTAAIVATTYGCSDDAQSDPPPPDAGNPTRRNDSGASSSGAVDAANDGTTGPTYKARATITSTGLPNSGTAGGTVDFTQSSGNIAVQVSITGATQGMHALHIHDGLSCANSTDPDAGAAGFAQQALGHWNPADAGHGLPTSATHHPGDFGNIAIDATGAGTLTLNATSFNVQPDGGSLSAIGHAVVFHQGTDDGTSQPTGDAGARAGCGIIQAQ